MDTDIIDDSEIEALLYEKLYYSNANFEDSNQFTSSCDTRGIVEVNKTAEDNLRTDDTVHNCNTNISPAQTQLHSNNTEENVSVKKSKKSNQIKDKMKMKKQKTREEQVMKILNKRKAFFEEASNPFKNSRKRFQSKDNFSKDGQNDTDNVVICTVSHRKNNASKTCELSDENDGKYNIQTKQQAKLQAESSKDVDLSDSEDSIYEVPVSPKPAPIIVNLESDDECNELQISMCCENNSNEFQENSDVSETNLDTKKNNSDIFEYNSEMSKDNLDVSLETNNSNVADRSIDFIDFSDDIIMEDNVSVPEDIPSDMILSYTQVNRRGVSLEEIRQSNRNTDNCNNLQSLVQSNTNQEVNDPATNDGNGPYESNSQEIQRQDKTSKKHSLSVLRKRMQDFYNKSWGGENFELDDVLSKMSDDSRHWQIVDEDVNVNQLSNRYWKVCKSCNKTGHNRNKCPYEKKKNHKKICFMCGITGHTDIHCPQRMCLNCGKKQKTFRKTCETCSKLRCISCNCFGHTVDNCPDNWRQFHNTTTGDVVTAPTNLENIMKPRYRLFCCNCAKKGHDYFSCQRYRWSSHFPTPAFVTNYKNKTGNRNCQSLINPFARGKNNPKNYPRQSETINRQNNVHLEERNNISNNPPPLMSIHTFANFVSSPTILPPDPAIQTQSIINNQPDKKVIFSLFNILPNFKQFKIQEIVIDRKEVVATLIAHQSRYDFLKELCEVSPFHLTLIWIKDNVFEAIVESIIHPPYFQYLSELIKMWLERTPEEQGNMIMLPQDIKEMGLLLKNNVRKWDQLMNPEQMYQEVKKLKAMVFSGNNDSILLNKYYEQQVNLNLSLYNYNIKTSAKKKIKTLHNLYRVYRRCKSTYKNTWLSHYYQLLIQVNILFTPYEPANLDQLMTSYRQMVSKRKNIQIQTYKTPPFSYHISHPQPQIHNPDQSQTVGALEERPQQANVLQYIQNIAEQSLPGNININQMPGNVCVNVNINSNLKNNVKINKNLSQEKKKGHLSQIRAQALNKSAQEAINRAMKLNNPSLAKDIRLIQIRMKNTELPQTKKFLTKFLKKFNNKIENIIKEIKATEGLKL